jgi:hypothetical protein
VVKDAALWRQRPRFESWQGYFFAMILIWVSLRFDEKNALSKTNSLCFSLRDAFFEHWQGYFFAMILTWVSLRFDEKNALSKTNSLCFSLRDAFFEHWQGYFFAMILIWVSQVSNSENLCSNFVYLTLYFIHKILE